ncbi:hypothetical protein HCQ94_05420 [Actinomyces sp. zg-332]|uniref:hypothetical protein n=1 Tax=Actinomyces sp. zg-332 TaxID=2708340 RepID=UPI00141FAB03|nr:hypothetical protein [Actinomyces sp. zg-332]QPK94005.1 hypothetical protein HCQ94_05420 [Actinomyces sp. zg-332]
MAMTQSERIKKYLANTLEAIENKKCSVLKSKAKNFITQHPTLEELEVFRTHTASREKELKEE